MKILMAHNYYQQAGGEDRVFADEASLLESRGHRVVSYEVHNESIRGMSRWSLLEKTIWNRQTYRELRTLIRQERPALLHCHNTFPLISPSAYAAARAEGIAVVQTLHNYRLLCPAAVFLRAGRPCEDCLGKSLAWPAVVHACYRQRRGTSAAVTGMVSLHRCLGTWQRRVQRYIALSDFSRKKFIAGGLPAERIAVKPNFVRLDPGPGSGEGGYAVFVGRLSAEKGVATLLAAWDRLPQPVPLKIVGDGPMAAEVRAAADRHDCIEYMGQRKQAEVLSILGGAACLVFPSTWYETFGRVLIEAYAKGTPVVASRLGAVAEIVKDGQSGFLFAPGNPDDLAAKVNLLLRESPIAPLRRGARAEYEAHYTAEKNYPGLMEIYGQSLAESGAEDPPDRHTSSSDGGMPAPAWRAFPCDDVTETSSGARK